MEDTDKDTIQTLTTLRNIQALLEEIETKLTNLLSTEDK